MLSDSNGRSYGPQVAEVKRNSGRGGLVEFKPDGTSRMNAIIVEECDRTASDEWG